MSSRHMLPSPAEMVVHLDRHVAGQERAKRVLASAVYRHYFGLATRGRFGAGRGFGPQHSLLIGPTGSGKTLLVRTLAELLDVPVLLGSAPSLVEAGYAGDHVETLFEQLLARAGGQTARAERGIIFLDEVDKIRASRDGFRDVSGEGVQNALLTVMDGRTIHIQHEYRDVQLNSANVLFIGAGAFVGLEEHVVRRLGGPPALGFRSPRPGVAGPAGGDGRPVGPGPLHQVVSDDLVRFGFIPELIGRFSTIAAVDPLSEEDLVRILTGTEASVVGRERDLFALHGVQLQFTKEGLQAIARDAMRRGTGARGLTARVRELLQPVSWRLPQLEAEGVRTVTVDEKVVAGDAPRLERGAKRSQTHSVADSLRMEAFSPAGAAAGSNPRLERVAAAAARERLRWLRDRVMGWYHASDETRAWWEALLKEHARKPQPLLHLANELVARKGTVDELHAAAAAAGCPSFEAWLHMLDCRRARAAAERSAEEQRRREERRRKRQEADAARIELPLAAQGARAQGETLGGPAEDAPATAPEADDTAAA